LPDTLYGTFDLEAVLQLPYAGDGKIYYSRKLSLLNFTIFDSFENGTCFLWDETRGKKGSAEIVTCLLKYLESIPDSIQHVILYCDTCSGQNCNRFMVAMMVHAVNTVRHLKTIDLKCMESGHSYLEPDSIHASIERAKKHRQLYLPHDYELVIQCSRQKPFPYILRRLSYDDIYDVEGLTERVVTSRTKNSQGQPINWLHVKWFRFEKSS